MHVCVYPLCLWCSRIEDIANNDADEDFDPEEQELEDEMNMMNKEVCLCLIALFFSLL